MASFTDKIPPPFDKKVDNYQKWKKKLNLWQGITEVEDTKQGAFIILALDEDTQDKILELVTEDEIESTDGANKVLENLDLLVEEEEEESLAAYFSYLDLANYYRPEHLSVDEYCFQFHKKLLKAHTYGTTLADSVLGYKLLKCANLTNFEEKIIKATIKDITYKSVAAQLKKVFRNVHPKTSMSIYESEIKRKTVRAEYMNIINKTSCSDTSDEFLHQSKDNIQIYNSEASENGMTINAECIKLSSAQFVNNECQLQNRFPFKMNECTDDSYSEVPLQHPIIQSGFIGNTVDSHNADGVGEEAYDIEAVVGVSAHKCESPELEVHGEYMQSHKFCSKSKMEVRQQNRKKAEAKSNGSITRRDNAKALLHKAEKTLSSLIKKRTAQNNQRLKVKTKRTHGRDKKRKKTVWRSPKKKWITQSKSKPTVEQKRRINKNGRRKKVWRSPKKKLIEESRAKVSLKQKRTHRRDKKRRKTWKSSKNLVEQKQLRRLAIVKLRCSRSEHSYCDTSVKQTWNTWMRRKKRLSCGISDLPGHCGSSTNTSRCIQCKLM